MGMALSPLAPVTLVLATGSTIILTPLCSDTLPRMAAITRGSSNFVAVMLPLMVRMPAPVCTLGLLPPLLPPCASNARLPMVSLNQPKAHCAPPRIFTRAVSPT